MRESTWTAVAEVYRRRVFVAGFAGSVAILAAAISLLVPNVYKAEARLLVPMGGGSGSLATALLSNLPSGASAFLGGGPAGDYSRYLTILTSRQMMEAVVDSFDLVRTYKLEDKNYPREAALAQLRSNVDFRVDERLEYLSVGVIDRDAGRSAEMTNFVVRHLNRSNARLSTESARMMRQYVEKRYDHTMAALDSVLERTQHFQEQHGVVDIPIQAQGHFEQLAQLRAAAIRAEIEYESLREQFGDDNPRVQAQRTVARSANTKYTGALSGAEAAFPVAQDDVPSLLRSFAELERERLVLTRVLEVIGPMLEQARFDEEREVQAVQVIDPAVPPVRKFAPRRTFIVIGAGASGLILAITYVLLMNWWTRNSAYVRGRLVATPQREVVRKRGAPDEEDVLV